MSPFRRTCLATALFALSSLLAGCSDLTEPGDPPPALELTAPTSGAEVDADSVVVEGAASDGGEVRRVTVQLGEGPEQEVQITPARQLSFRVVLRNVSLGNLTLRVRAYDDGDRSVEKALTISTKDLHAPAVEALTPTAGELVPRDSVRISGTLTDPRGVGGLSYSLDGAAAVAVPIEVGTRVPFGFTLRPAPGEHSLVLRATDREGNSTERAVTFTTSAARITIASPRPDTTLSIFNFGLRAQIDSPVPISQVRISLNGGPEVDRCPAPYTCLTRVGTADEWLSSPVVDSLRLGKNTIAVTAYDASGRKLGASSTVVNVSVPVRRYSVQYLGTLGGGDSRGVELNEKNQVVGFSETTQGASRIFVWDGARLNDLGLTSPSIGLHQLAINESGEAVGIYQADCRRSFYWRIGQSGPTETIGDGCNWLAADINDLGMIALSNPLAEPRSLGYILNHATGTRIPVNMEVGLSRAYFLWMNNRGLILGVAPSAGPYLFFYVDRPPGEGFRFVYAGDLNDRDEFLTEPAVAQYGYVGGPSGRTEVRTPGYGTRGELRGLNNHREVAGMYVLSERRTPEFRQGKAPFFWKDGTSYHIELTDAAWEVDEVSDLSDAGVILAHARNTSTGAQGAVLLTP